MLHSWVDQDIIQSFDYINWNRKSYMNENPSHLKQTFKYKIYVFFQTKKFFKCYKLDTNSIMHFISIRLSFQCNVQGRLWLHLMSIASSTASSIPNNNIYAIWYTATCHHCIFPLSMSDENAQRLQSELSSYVDIMCSITPISTRSQL